MKRWTWLIPVVLAVVVYAPAFFGELVWDDAIVVNKQILVFKNVGDVFSPPDHIPQWAKNYYRPVVVLTYLLDHSLFGSSASLGPHVSNILFHALVTFFVWIFATQCLRNLPNSRWGAVLAAGIFAVHPIHTESVSWITGRSDTVAAMFMMPSIVAALYYRDRRARWSLALAPGLFLLAVLSKEVALSTLLVLPVLFFLVPKEPVRAQADCSTSVEKRPKRRGKKKTPTPPQALSMKPDASGQTMRSWLILGALYVIATLVYFALRHQAHAGYGSSLDSAPGELLGRAWRAMAYYLAKAVVPTPQLHFVALENLPSAMWSTLIMSVAAAGVAFSIWWRRRGVPLALISLAWFFCTISPSLVIAVKKISENPVAERYLYLPSVALGLILGGLLCLGIERNRLRVFVIGLAVLTIGIYGVGTVRRGMIWTDNVRLWSDATQKTPNQGLPWTELGQAYIQDEKLDEALTSFHRAIKSDYDREGRSIAHNNIGMVHLRRGELDEAESHFKTAIRERQKYPTPHYGLGLVYLKKTQDTQSVKEASQRAQYAAERFTFAVRLNPNYTKALWGLTKTQIVTGSLAEKAGEGELAVAQYRAALDTFKNLLQIDPQFSSRHPSQAQSMEKLRGRLKLLI